MNIFDAIVVAAALVAIVAGFRSGLLRSLAAIAAYIVAAPVAIVAAPKLVPLVTTQARISTEYTALIFLGVLVVVGAIISALFRSAINVATGEDIHVADRAGGALLGAVRVALLAVFMILVFERIVPPNRQPAWLAQSRLQPYLSAAGQQGVRRLPPDMIAYIDRLKRERGIETNARAPARR
jgi:membrane protein required for colicin V production